MKSHIDEIRNDALGLSLIHIFVRGIARTDDCIFRLRDHMHSLVDQLSKLDDYIPPPFRLEHEEEEKESEQKEEKENGDHPTA